MTKTEWQLDNSYGQLPQQFYTKVHPTPVSNPNVVLFNEALAKGIGLKVDRPQHQDDFLGIFSGNKPPKNAEPLAQAYAGHQFGHFTMLGDGRAILLGEHITPQGQRLDIQLKGAGRTPYSRGGDGRAALGPMLREYLMSEAMHELGIPTTRGLAVVTTGEEVTREIDYAGAILTRVAASHLRVGTFQFAATYGTKKELKSLANYAIDRHGLDGLEQENIYLHLLETVINRQAQLIAKWQLVGFIHGVMNTDNMTISGETIDYGPCAFMDTYDPKTVFSSIDEQGRYAYGNQPYIGGWNLTRLAEALLPILHEDEDKAIELAQHELSKYPDVYQRHWLSGMRAKLGLFSEQTGDEKLIANLLKLMLNHHADYTNTFIALTTDQMENLALFKTKAFSEWHDQWSQRLTQQAEKQAEIKRWMKKNNPAVIPRNHLVEAALEAATEKADYSVMKNLLKVLSQPYDYSKAQEKYQTVPEQTTRYQTYCGT